MFLGSKSTLMATWWVKNGETVIIKLLAYGKDNLKITISDIGKFAIIGYIMYIVVFGSSFPGAQIAVGAKNTLLKRKAD